MNSHTWPLRENVRYLSVLMLCVLCLVFDSRQLLFLLASWISLIVIFGNVRHLPHSSGLLYALRMTLYFLPYALPAVIFLTSGFTFNARAAIGCAASECIHPEVTWKRIEDGVSAALAELKSNPVKPMHDASYILEIEFATTSHASLALRLPGSNSTTPTTVRYKAEDYMSIYNAYLCMAALSASFEERN